MRLNKELLLRATAGGEAGLPSQRPPSPVGASGGGLACEAWVPEGL